MKKIIPYVIFLLIGLTVGHLASDKVLDAQKVLLTRAKKILDHRLDSMEIVRAVGTHRDSIWTRISKADRDSLVVQRQLTQEQAKQSKSWYEKYILARNTPVARYNEHQLDSAITALIKTRRNIRP